MFSRERIIGLDRIAKSRRRIWRVDEVNGVRFQPRGAEPSPRFEGDHEEGREGGIVARRLGDRRRGQRRLGCPGTTRPGTGRRLRYERTVDARLAAVTLVPGEGDVAAAARRRDLGGRQRSDDHQECQSAPGNSVDHARPQGRHGIGSGVGCAEGRIPSYRRYARFASKVRNWAAQPTSCNPWAWSNPSPLSRSAA